MMKNLKKALSLSLAFALSLSLTVPALADDELPMSVEEGVAPISIEYEGGYAEIERDDTLYSYSWTSDTISDKQIDAFKAIKSGSRITVSHTGSDPDTFMYVFFQKYTRSSETKMVEYIEYSEDGSDMQMLTADFKDKYYDDAMYFTYISNTRTAGEGNDTVSVADGTGHYWNRGFFAVEVNDDHTPEFYQENVDAIILYPGNSVTFTLPDDGSDTIYQLYAEICYPQYPQFYWRSSNIKIDDALAASAPAEPEQPAAPAEPEQPAEPSGISVTVDGTAVTWTDVAPFIDANDRTMVPLRAVADAMGLDVDWAASARVASFSDGDKIISFPIDSNTAQTSDGGSVQMDTAAVIVNERTYAPIRYLAEYFGYQVGWDGAAQTVSLTK